MTKRHPLLSLLCVLIMAVILPLNLAAADRRLFQYFGDASTVTFSTGTYVAGTQIVVTVNGVPSSYVWASATTVTLPAAPAARSIVNVIARTGSEDGNKGNFTSLQVGPGYQVQGAVITSILTTSASVDFDSALTLADSTDVPITVTGAAVNDTCTVGLPAAPTAGHDYKCFVSAANTVQIRSHNGTAGTINQGALTFRVTVIHY